MKHLKLLILFLLMGVSAQAEETVRSLVINLQDGKQTMFALKDAPVITIKNETLLVEIGGQTKASIPITDVLNYVFDDIPVGISSTKMNGPAPKLINGHVLFTQIEEGQAVSVYTTDGRQIKTYRANANGQVDADLSTLPHGSYIVKSPSTTIKFINK